MRLTVFGIVMGIFIVAACTPSSNTTEPTAEKSESSPTNPCYFPDTTELAPGWICGELVEGYPLTAVGTAEKHLSRTSKVFQQSMATNDARIKLVRKKQQKVKGVIKTKTLRAITAPNGDLYVLIAVVE